LPFNGALARTAAIQLHLDDILCHHCCSAVCPKIALWSGLDNVERMGDRGAYGHPSCWQLPAPTAGRVQRADVLVQRRRAGGEDDAPLSRRAVVGGAVLGGW
jgi:hypothetical protein